MMRNKCLYIVSTISLTCICFLVHAQEDFAKNITKTYQLHENSKLSITNKYGNIDVRDWDRNEVRIDVEITIHDNSENKANEALKNIEIDFAVEKNEIIVSTQFSDKFFNLISSTKHSDNKKFEVNYKVTLPPTLSLNIKNSYGDLFVSKLYSISNLNVAYGNFQVNELIINAQEKMSEVNLSYSKGNIEKCKWLKINLNYSRLNIGESKALIIVSKNSKLFLQKCSSIVSESRYDAYEVGEVVNFVANSQYSNFKFDKIAKKVNLKTKYSDVRVIDIPASFESIDIENSYGTINLGIAEDASYKLNGYAKYSKIEYPDNSNVNEFEQNNEFKVDGIIGQKSGVLPNIVIDTEYGGVKLIK
jgi:hypothetical protein